MWFLQPPARRPADRRRKDDAVPVRVFPPLVPDDRDAVRDRDVPEPDRARRPDRPAADPRAAPAFAPVLAPVPRPDLEGRGRLVRLKRPDAPHRGRREERRARDRRSRAEREEGLLHMLAVFRVASRRNIVNAVFDGHPFAANRVLGGLERRGLVVKQTVTRGKRGYQVYMLTGRGRDLVPGRGPDRQLPVSVAGPQRYWSAGGDPRQMRHDHHVFDAVVADVSDCLARGGRVVRVRLESELRGRLAAADALGRVAGGPQEASRARRSEAVRVGLQVFAAGVPLPEALVELEEADGTRSVRSIEVASGAYSSKQVAEKRAAGFRVYAMPGFRGDDGGRRRARLPEEEFPLSWAR